MYQVFSLFSWDHEWSISRHPWLAAYFRLARHVELQSACLNQQVKPQVNITTRNVLYAMSPSRYLPSSTLGSSCLICVWRRPSHVPNHQFLRFLIV